MTTEYSKSQNNKASQPRDRTKIIRDYNIELEFVWLDFGDQPDIKQVENWRSLEDGKEWRVVQESKHAEIRRSKIIAYAESQKN